MSVLAEAEAKRAIEALIVGENNDAIARKLKQECLRVYKQVESIAFERDQVYQTVCELKKLAQDTKQDYEKIKEDRNQLKKDIEEVRAERRKATTDLNTAQTELSEKQCDIEDKDRQLHLLNSKVQELTRRLEDAERAVRETACKEQLYEEALQRLKDQLKRDKQPNEGEQGKKEHEDNRLREEEEGHKQALVDQLRALQEKARKMDVERATWERECESFEEEREKFRKLQRDLLEDRDKDRTRLLRERGDMDTIAGDLESQLESTKEEVVKMRRHAMDRESEMDDLVRKLRGALNEREAELESAKRVVRTREEEVEKLKAYSGTETEQVNKLQQAKRAMEDEFDKQISQLRGDIVQLEEDLEQAKGANAQLVTQVKDLEEASEASTKHLSVLGEEGSKKVREMQDKLVAVKEDSAKQKRAYQDQVLERDGIIRDVKAKVKQLEINELEQQRAAKERERMLREHNSQLESEKAAISRDLDREKKAASSALEAMQQANNARKGSSMKDSEWQAREQELLNARTAEREQLMDEVADKAAELDQLRQKMRKMEDDRLTAEEEHRIKEALTTQDRAQREAELDALQRLLENERKKTSEYASIEQNLQAKERSLQSQMRGMQGQQQELLNEIAALKRKQSECQQQAQQDVQAEHSRTQALEKEWEEKQQEALEARETERRRRVAEVEAVNTELSKFKQHADDTIAKLKQQMDDREKELVAAERIKLRGRDEENDQLQSQLEKAKKRAAWLEQELEREHTSAVAKESEINSRTETHIDELNNQIRCLQSRYKDIQSDNADIQRQLEVERQRNKEAEQARAQQIEKDKEREKERDSMRQRQRKMFEDREMELQNEIRRLNDRIIQLESQLLGLQGDMGEREKQLERRLYELEEKETAASTAKRDLQFQLDQCKASMQLTVNQLQEAQVEIQNAERDATEKRARLAEALEREHLVTQKVKFLQQEKEQLAGTLDQERGKLKDCRGRMIQLEQELDDFLVKEQQYKTKHDALTMKELESQQREAKLREAFQGELNNLKFNHQNDVKQLLTLKDELQNQVQHLLAKDTEKSKQHVVDNEALQCMRRKYELRIHQLEQETEAAHLTYGKRLKGNQDRLCYLLFLLNSIRQLRDHFVKWKVFAATRKKHRYELCCQLERRNQQKTLWHYYMMWLSFVSQYRGVKHKRRQLAAELLKRNNLIALGRRYLKMWYDYIEKQNDQRKGVQMEKDLQQYYYNWAHFMISAKERKFNEMLVDERKHSQQEKDAIQDDRVKVATEKLECLREKEEALQRANLAMEELTRLRQKERVMGDTETTVQRKDLELSAKEAELAAKEADFERGIEERMRERAREWEKDMHERGLELQARQMHMLAQREAEVESALRDKSIELEARETELCIRESHLQDSQVQIMPIAVPMPTTIPPPMLPIRMGSPPPPPIGGGMPMIGINRGPTAMDTTTRVEHTELLKKSGIAGGNGNMFVGNTTIASNLPARLSGGERSGSVHFHTTTTTGYSTDLMEETKALREVLTRDSGLSPSPPLTVTESHRSSPFLSSTPIPIPTTTQHNNTSNTTNNNIGSVGLSPSTTHNSSSMTTTSMSTTELLQSSGGTTTTTTVDIPSSPSPSGFGGIIMPPHNMQLGHPPQVGIGVSPPRNTGIVTPIHARPQYHLTHTTNGGSPPRNTGRLQGTTTQLHQQQQQQTLPSVNSTDYLATLRKDWEQGNLKTDMLQKTIEHESVLLQVHATHEPQELAGIGLEQSSFNHIQRVLLTDQPFMHTRRASLTSNTSTARARSKSPTNMMHHRQWNKYF